MSAALSIAETQNAIERVAATGTKLDKLAEHGRAIADLDGDDVIGVVEDVGCALTDIACVLRQLDERTRGLAR